MKEGREGGREGGGEGVGEERREGTKRKERKIDFYRTQTLGLLLFRGTHFIGF